MSNIFDQKMPSLLWTIDFDRKETREGRIELRVLPNGYYRFSLLLRDPEDRGVIGVIEGFRIDRDWISILPPASRGTKNEIYNFIKFTPKMLTILMEEVKNEYARFKEEAHWIGRLAGAERGEPDPGPYKGWYPEKAQLEEEARQGETIISINYPTDRD